MPAGRSAHAHKATSRRKFYEIDVLPVERSEPDLRRFARAILLHAQREAEHAAHDRPAEPAREDAA